MGTQPECRTWNPRQGGRGDREGHNPGSKGLGPKASRSGVHNVRQPPWFRASNNAIKYTTEELLNIATNEEVAEPLLVPSGREAIPSSS
jgi:hypothetical protein